MSFWELLVVAVVGLLVIGPDKLPETIKTVLTWGRRIRRIVNDTRSEIEQQLGVDEIKREIHNQEVLDSLKALNIAQQQAQKDLASVGERVGERAHQLAASIREDFEPEDEGLFGDQRSNHPPEPPVPPASEVSETNKTDRSDT